MKVFSSKRVSDSYSDNPKSKIENLKLVGLVTLIIAFVICGVAVEAQQAKKIPRIGLLRAGAASDPSVDAFRQGLRELGYIEGKNIFIEYRFAEEKLERLPALAEELVRLNLDVIVVQGPQAIPAAKNATKTIPIVMGSPDPVGTGLVESLA
jgi:putative ABC transport system substrate-binding protein